MTQSRHRQSRSMGTTFHSYESLHRSCTSFDQDFNLFSQSYPEYDPASSIDDLRHREYGRLDAAGEIYLDYTGGSLYAASQLRTHNNLLANGTFGNPHSASRASIAAAEHIKAVRHSILHFFNADAEEYFVVFTANSTGAIKLVAEAFPFRPSSRLLLTADNHNSVNGIRVFAATQGARVDYVPLMLPDLRLDRKALEALLEFPGPAGLFALPAQSNFSGVKHSLSLVEQAKHKGWKVLLDAAAYAPTNRLDLSQIKPDFVAISFYKMFGYPTGLGALLMRRSTAGFLKRPWFAGGTVRFASVQAQVHVLSSNEEAFEDGTVDYLSIPAILFGLQHLQSVGIDNIQKRTASLTSWMLEQLQGIRHFNGKRLVRIYGPTTVKDRGATIAMNLYDPAGSFIDYHRIEELASVEGISIRVGCFCNPGVGEIAAGLTTAEMLSSLVLGDSLSLPRFTQWMRENGINKDAGAVRISLGIASNFRDAWAFAKFIRNLKDTPRLAIESLDR